MVYCSRIRELGGAAREHVTAKIHSQMAAGGGYDALIGMQHLVVAHCGEADVLYQYTSIEGPEHEHCRGSAEACLGDLAYGGGHDMLVEYGISLVTRVRRRQMSWAGVIPRDGISAVSHVQEGRCGDRIEDERCFKPGWYVVLSGGCWWCGTRDKG